MSTTPLSPATGGRIANAPLRAAFEASGMSAGLVADHLGWTYSRDGRATPDSSRVKRALGLMDARGGGRYGRPPASAGRTSTVHVDLAERIADIIGADLQDVGL